MTEHDFCLSLLSEPAARLAPTLWPRHVLCKAQSVPLLATLVVTLPQTLLFRWAVQGLCSAMPGEQLAYVAALAVGAPLLFGDRPKRDTYACLSSLTSLSELDAFFGWQVRRDSCDLLGNPSMCHASRSGRLLLLVSKAT